MRIGVLQLFLIVVTVPLLCLSALVEERANANRALGASDALSDGRISLAKLGPFTARRLPTKIELSVPERGVESMVIDYLDDPSKQVDPAVWFNFDRLLFETGSAKLRP